MAGETTYSTYASLKSNFVFKEKALEQVFKKVRLYEATSKFPLPKQEGNDTMRMWRSDEPNANNVGEVTEGLTNLNASQSNILTVNIQLKQYYVHRRITKRSTKFERINLLKLAREDMGKDFAYWTDAQIRNEVVANVLSANNLFAQSTGSFSGLQGASWSTGKLTLQDIDKGRAVLENSGTPMFSNDRYRLYVSPSVHRDLKRDNEYINFVQYSEPERRINGYAGTIGGVDVIVSNKQFSEPISGGAQGTYSDGGQIHSSLMLGQQAVGAANLEGEKGPMGSQAIILDQPEKTDAADQWIYATFLAWFAPKLLKNDWAVNLRSRTDMP